MNFTKLFLATLAVAIPLNSSGQLVADDITFYGDFIDGGGLITYDSSDPYMPGSFILDFSEEVLGIPKFDTSLGTLTDITVFVDDLEPIFYDIDGLIDAFEIDPLSPFGFAAEVVVIADIGINYETPSSSLASVITDSFDLSGSCGGSSGDGDCTDIVFPSADGIIEGSTSVYSLVDLADFEGVGDVDTLFVQLFIESTAMFPTLENADAIADVIYDIYDASPSLDDATIGVTYTYTPVPEPATLMLAASSLVLLGLRKRAG